MMCACVRVAMQQELVLQPYEDMRGGRGNDVLQIRE